MDPRHRTSIIHTATRECPFLDRATRLLMDDLLWWKVQFVFRASCAWLSILIEDQFTYSLLTSTNGSSGYGRVTLVASLVSYKQSSWGWMAGLLPAIISIYTRQSMLWSFIVGGRIRNLAQGENYEPFKTAPPNCSFLLHNIQSKNGGARLEIPLSHGCLGSDD